MTHNGMSVAEWKSVLETLRKGSPARDDRHNVQSEGDISDDDYNIDLARAALKTATDAFDRQDWHEAESMFQEALRLLQDIPAQQRAFCDIFGLNYRLAVCAFYTQNQHIAEEALSSLESQSADTNEHQAYSYDATYLLSILRIRAGNLDRAQSECDRALRGRRKLLGKESDAALESIALMAHIHALLNNHHRAKTVFSMIPEGKRSAVSKTIQDLLSLHADHLNLQGGQGGRVAEYSSIAVHQDRPFVNHIPQHSEPFNFGIATHDSTPRPSSFQQSDEDLSPKSSMLKSPKSPSLSSPAISRSPAAGIPRASTPNVRPWSGEQGLQVNSMGQQNYDQNTAAETRNSDIFYSPTVSHQNIGLGLAQPRSQFASGGDAGSMHTTRSNPQMQVDERGKLSSQQQQFENGDYAKNTNQIETFATPTSPSLVDEPGSQPLSRQQILDRIGCLPRDELEDAVCSGNRVAFSNLLGRKSEIWRSKWRKRVRPERVTALHFAALFGEIDMARRLVDSKFNVNEIPWGYSTIYTPLKFAIGAREVAMVDFLISKGAAPTVPESWATLAGQLMNRSWLQKTLSEANKKQAPGKMTAILRMLLNYGLDVNAPIDASGGRLLHQAVTFGTPQNIWDMELRASMTSFLCDKGANAFEANTEGKTPYDLALLSGSQNLLSIFDRGSKVNGIDAQMKTPIELSAVQSTSPVELSG